MRAFSEPRNGYLYVKVTGEFSTPAVQEIFSKCREDARRQALHRILWDMTDVTGSDSEAVSSTTLSQAARLAAETMGGKFRLAFLARPKRLAGDPFTENAFVHRGSKVKVTSDPDEAHRWVTKIRHRVSKGRAHRFPPLQTLVSPEWRHKRHHRLRGEIEEPIPWLPVIISCRSHVSWCSCCCGRSFRRDDFRCPIHLSASLILPGT